MTNSIAVYATAAVSLLVGSAVGGAVARIVTTAEVTCSVPAAADQPPNGMAKLLQTTPIPLTGYKSY